MKKLLIGTLCLLAACQTKREKVSEDQLLDTSNEYKCVLGPMHNIYAARHKSGKWEVFVADSALETLFKNYPQDTVIYTESKVITPVWKDTIVHEVWVVDYGKKLFKVGYAAINSNSGFDSWFYCDHPGVSCGYSMGDERQAIAYKKIISKPIPLSQVATTKKYFYKIMQAALDSVGSNRRTKNHLDSIGKSLSK